MGYFREIALLKYIFILFMLMFTFSFLAYANESVSSEINESAGGIIVEMEPEKVEVENPESTKSVYSPPKKKQPGKISGWGIFCIIFAIIGWLLAGVIEKQDKGVIAEIEQNLVEVENAKVLPENEGKLVFVRGKLEPAEAPQTDPEFGVKLKTVAMIRFVEMYQWDEETEVEEDDDGNTTTHTYYVKRWANKLINSDSFTSSKKNPKEKPFKSIFYSEGTTVGDYVPTKNMMEELKLKTVFTELSEEVAEKHGFFIADEKYYTNMKTQNPRIGDIRISFLYITSEESPNVSILAKQSGNTFDVFPTKKADTSSQWDKGMNKMWLKDMDREQLAAELFSSTKSMKQGCAIFLGLIAILGFALIYSKMKDG